METNIEEKQNTISGTPHPFMPMGLFLARFIPIAAQGWVYQESGNVQGGEAREMDGVNPQWLLAA
jgi:hypothetical protein